MYFHIFEFLFNLPAPESPFEDYPELVGKNE
jgi:hypothetical protein